jgi:hypothetical protein
MRQPRARWILFAGFVASVLLAAALGKRTASPTTPPLPLNDWGVPELADYLQRAGIRLHVVPATKDGVVGDTAFLSTTANSWPELNRLRKDANQLARWRGILYCERLEHKKMRRVLEEQWGDYGWSAGPFLFYGDPELLARVRAVLLDASLGTLPHVRLAVVLHTLAA